MVISCTCSGAYRSRHACTYSSHPVVCSRRKSIAHASSCSVSRTWAIALWMEMSPLIVEKW